VSHTWILFRAAPYFVLPTALALAASFASFGVDVPITPAVSALLVSVVVLAVADDRLFQHWIPPYHPQCLAPAFSFSQSERWLLCAYAASIVTVGVAEMAIFGVPIFAPETYSDFSGGRLHFRHISNLCWTLVPLGLLGLSRRRSIDYGLILFGLAFPVIAVDRNRLIAALLAGLLIILLRRTRPISLVWVVATAFAIAAAFGGIGLYRSGDVIHSTLNFSQLYLDMPSLFRGVLLYIGIGIYNLGAVDATGYRDSGVLLGQLLPFVFAAPPHEVPLHDRFLNVGTEFLPFAIAGGWPLVPVGVAVCWALLAGSIWLLLTRPTVFSLLIFLRQAYVAIMTPFAPQALTWTNFGFIFLFLAMWYVSGQLEAISRHLPESLARYLR
jgi:hypothetical protein